MLEKKNLEKDILVISTEKVKHINFGFTPANKEEVLKLATQGQYQLRKKMEEDLRFKQFLPYVVIKKNNEIFTYQRSKSGGEKRLFDQWSLGVGGHVDYPDNLISSTLKELEEEIELKVSEDDLNFVGFINAKEKNVDLFHLGIAIVVEVSEDFDFSKGELNKITNRSFDNKEVLKNKSNKFETWSKIFFEQYLEKALK